MNFRVIEEIQNLMIENQKLKSQLAEKDYALHDKVDREEKNNIRQAVRIQELIQKDAAKSAEILKLKNEIMKLTISEHEAMKKIGEPEPSKHWQWSSNNSFLKYEAAKLSEVYKHNVDDLSRKLSNYKNKKKLFVKVDSKMNKLKKELGRSVCEKNELKRIIKRKDQNLKVMLDEIKRSCKRKKR